MKKTLLLGVALAALAFAAPASAELKFPPGEDARFHWDNFEALKQVDLKRRDAHDLRAVARRGRGAGALGARLFHRSDRRRRSTIRRRRTTSSRSSSTRRPAARPTSPSCRSRASSQDLASKGLLVPLGDDVATFVKDNYGAGQSWVDLGTYKDKDGAEKFFAFPYKADLKSLVWYVPENFEEAGYEVPKTWEEMQALSDKIVADGGVPWCIGLGSGGATGWPATDWVEDIMLRTASPETYDKWTTNEIPFNDPAVVNALQIFADIATNDKYVDGGKAAVAATDFRDSPKGLFGLPPKCYLHRQASFISSFFPEGTKLGEDADFFYLPPMAAKPSSAIRCSAPARWSPSPRTRRPRANSSSSSRCRWRMKSGWRSQACSPR